MTKKKEPTFPLGIILLCPTLRLKDAEITLSWMKSYLEPELANVLAILPPTKEKNTQAQFGELCKTYRSKNDSYLSMVNKGMQYTKSNWNLIVKAGSKFRTNLHNQLFQFAKEETDILYPVTTEHHHFWDSPLGWLYLTQEGFKAGGKFDEEIDAEHAKLIWMATAHEAGAAFKGVVGLRV